ncbi:pol-like protein [Brachionus plicatilis]|uniref:Pol-like protein n=1 Tax=Brachionus plicatilis TaxID=10195 RepID=A0A3M7QS72_BRAPC|nr:pol-like protein [Brachionus plicatilis]
MIIYEVKSTAYADDIIGYVSDELSIELFFQEFDEWGEISGARINKEKTKTIHINKNDKEIEDFKVLGILFNKKGISLQNYKNALEKIKKAIYIWDIPSLNMLERITICKTFILKKKKII